MKKVAIIFLALLCVCISQAPAQQSGAGSATIIYAQGNTFTLSRESGVTEYDLYYDDVIGLDLEAGDYISTDSGTFLEVQLKGSRNVLKISENTSFTLQQVGSEGGGSVELTYGRVRAKVAKLVGDDSFSIRGPSVVAGVRGTDFGYDIIAGVEGNFDQSMARVYCFEGEVEVNKVKKVTPSAAEDALEEGAPKAPKEEIFETIIIRANEMAFLPVETPEEPLEITPIEEEVVSFWEVNDFQGELIEPEKPEEPEAEGAGEEEELAEEGEQEVETAEETVPEPGKEPNKVFSKKETLFGVGTGVLIGGIVVETAGLLTYFLGQEIFPGSDPLLMNDLGTGLMVGGGVLITGAFITYLASLLAE
jgi:hypothetical protein